MLTFRRWGGRLVYEFAADADLARRGCSEAADQTERRRLAASRGTEQAEKLPVLNLQVDRVNRRLGAIALRDAGELDRRSTHCSIRRVADHLHQRQRLAPLRSARSVPTSPLGSGRASGTTGPPLDAQGAEEVAIDLLLVRSPSGRIGRLREDVLLDDKPARVATAADSVKHRLERDVTLTQRTERPTPPDLICVAVIGRRCRPESTDARP